MRLRDQVDDWVARGTIEASAGEAIKQVSLHPEWLDLNGRTLFEIAENSCGKLSSEPTSREDACDISWLANNAGANLLLQAPQVSQWLLEGKTDEHSPVTIGNYTYLDGGKHVQLSLACDSIIEAVCRSRFDVSIAFLCTPTDCHVIESAAFESAKKKLLEVSLWQSLWDSLGFLKSNSSVDMVVEISDEKSLHMVDGLVLDQGPNYALAKRLQHWRAIVAHSKKHTVSANVAPSTATLSVVKNKSFAAAYKGMHIFQPLEVFYQHTSNAVMEALLIYDISCENSPGNGRNAKKLNNPLELFKYVRAHRCAFTIGSIGIPSAVSHYISVYWFKIFTILWLAAGCWFSSYISNLIFVF
eukprot:GSMAST32.ASY1.ANO1.2183.1 assembled CDS